MLSDPFFYGEYEYPEGSGNWYKGEHEPMITKQEYDKVQVILGRKRKERRQKHTFPFTSLMTCGECGETVVAEYRKKVQVNGTVHLYTHYHCTKKRKDPKCSQSVVHEKDLEPQMSKIIGNIDLPQDFADWAMEVIRRRNREESGVRDSVLNNQRNSYDKCLKKIDALIDMRANGEISEEEFLSRKVVALEEKERLHGIMSNVDGRVNEWLNILDEGFAFAAEAKKTFEKTESPIRKKEMMRTACSNLSLKDGKVAYTLGKPFDSLQIVRETYEAEKESVRTAMYGSIKGQTEALRLRCPKMLRGSDSNRRPSGYT